MSDQDRIVITGIGLTSPNGNSLAEYRQNLLEGKSGVVNYETRYMGPVLAGVCNFDELRYQKKKDIRRGTRAGSIAVYCANEAVKNSGLDWPKVARDRVGVYIGITEHGNVETENEIHSIFSGQQPPLGGGELRAAAFHHYYRSARYQLLRAARYSRSRSGALLHRPP